MSSRVAVYAGSFDPVTCGHMYVIEQAARLFDNLIIAVGNNFEKRPHFSERERRTFVEISTEHLSNVRVTTFSDTLLVDYAQSVGAGYIVRGIRSGADFVFEQQMRMVIAKIQPHIEIVYFIPPPRLAEVSSTLVRELMGVPNTRHILRDYVPEPVFRALFSQSER